MQTNKENQFNIIGITARTSNKAEMQGNGLIPKLWQQFFADQILSKIPNITNHSIIVAYYDYASDKDGQYSVLIGARAPETDNLAHGMINVTIPAGNYAIFLSEQGPIAQVAFKTWQNIWHLEDQKELNRKYAVDYEIYDQRAQNPANAQVEIHIRVD